MSNAAREDVCVYILNVQKSKKFAYATHISLMKSYYVDISIILN